MTAFKLVYALHKNEMIHNLNIFWTTFPLSRVKDYILVHTFIIQFCTIDNGLVIQNVYRNQKISFFCVQYSVI